VEFFEALLSQRTAVPRRDAPNPAAGTAAADAAAADAETKAEAEVEAADLPEHADEPADGVTLLVCGSLASWAIRRRRAQERGVTVFELPEDPRSVVQALERHGIALLGIGDQSVIRPVPPSALVALLAECVAGVLRHASVDRLLLEGGATAAAVVRRLGWFRLRACRPPAPGVGAFLPLGPARSRLFIKPGSYPWPDGLW
jgi:D-threonate/D-erythronate kinase